MLFRSYELPVTETFTVPGAAPYVYNLLQGCKLITFGGVSTTATPPVPVACTHSAGLLTFDESLAGQSLTVSYTIDICPKTIVFAIMLLIGHLYEHREAASELALKEIPLGVAELLAGDTFDTFDW